MAKFEKFDKEALPIIVEATGISALAAKSTTTRRLTIERGNDKDSFASTEADKTKVIE